MCHIYTFYCRVAACCSLLAGFCFTMDNCVCITINFSQIMCVYTWMDFVTRPNVAFIVQPKPPPKKKKQTKKEKQIQLQWDEIERVVVRRAMWATFNICCRFTTKISYYLLMIWRVADEAARVDACSFAPWNNNVIVSFLGSWIHILYRYSTIRVL